MSHWLRLCYISEVSDTDARWLRDNAKLEHDDSSSNGMELEDDDISLRCLVMYAFLFQKYQCLNADYTADKYVEAIKPHLFRYDFDTGGTMTHTLMFRQVTLYSYPDDDLVLTDCMNAVAEHYGSWFVYNGYSPVTVGMLATLLEHEDMTVDKLHELWTNEDDEDREFDDEEWPASDIYSKIIPGLFLLSQMPPCWDGGKNT